MQTSNLEGEVRRTKAENFCARHAKNSVTVYLS